MRAVGDQVGPRRLGTGTCAVLSSWRGPDLVRGQLGTPAAQVSTGSSCRALARWQGATAPSAQPGLAGATAMSA